LDLICFERRIGVRQRATLNRDLSAKMRENDEVEIVSLDAMIIDRRIGDIFNVENDEVVIKKSKDFNMNSIIYFSVCKKKYLNYKKYSKNR
jgi:hypothetical protein